MYINDPLDELDWDEYTPGDADLASSLSCGIIIDEREMEETGLHIVEDNA